LSAFGRLRVIKPTAPRCSAMIISGRAGAENWRMEKADLRAFCETLESVVIGAMVDVMSVGEDTIFVDVLTTAAREETLETALVFIDAFEAFTTLRCFWLVEAGLMERFINNLGDGKNEVRIRK